MLNVICSSFQHPASVQLLFVFALLHFFPFCSGILQEDII